ncbi:ATP-binding cassette domain-containing protein [Yinghuangia sp. YIM S09857]|uniref:ATP-binding cassette domain-containing protein n=1 Tax=Yinghuangia sp. YIM S09857 TaxID=3436929 RepID=UPI003F536462
MTEHTDAATGEHADDIPAPRSAPDEPPGVRLTDADSGEERDDELTYVSAAAETDAKLHTVTTRAMALRLPRLIGTALRLAWGSDRKVLVALLACQVAAGVLAAAGLLATTATITAVISTGDVVARLRDAAPALTLLAVAVGARAGLGIVVVYLSQRLTPLLARKAETMLLEAVAVAELEAYDHPRFLALYNTADRGAQSMRQLLTHSQDVIAAVASFAAAASVIAYLHWLLLPLLFLGAVPRGVTAVRAARIEYRTSTETQHERVLLANLRWNIADDWGANQLRAFTLAPHLLDVYQRHADKVELLQRRSALRTARVSAAGALCGGLAAGLVWAAVCWLLATDRMSVAAAGTAVLALTTVSGSLGGIVSAGTSMYGSGLYMDQWDAFLRQAGGHRMSLHRGSNVVDQPSRFRADSVSFTYHNRDTPALDGVTLEVQVGNIVALVGENGSGKSTLANLLTGLYLPTKGAVTWDGHDTRTLDPHHGWRQICYLPQDVVRWPLVARDNITAGQQRPDHEHALAHALAASGADEVVAELKNGLRTSLAHKFMGGTDLSGGQWQRINLARAFYRAGRLLVLDEPTSALDPRAEHKIFMGLRAHAHDRAIVLVTHRLANVALADEIVVLDHGRVIQRGTFDELKAKPGLFRELWLLQQDR